jgi:hypothetical protein
MCMCEWPPDCGGLGVLQCDGCGGDLCVCVCGGECECYGCALCAGDDYDDDYGPDPVTRKEE